MLREFRIDLRVTRRTRYVQLYRCNVDVDTPADSALAVIVVRLLQRTYAGKLCVRQPTSCRC